MAMTWDPSLLTGVVDLDRQHREIFLRLDALIDAIRRGCSRDEVGRTLAFLASYVVDHFAAEEALWDEVGYPGAERHRAEHTRFAQDLAALVSEHRRDGATPSLIVRVNGWLTGWLREHIGRSDREAAAFFRTRAA